MPLIVLVARSVAGELFFVFSFPLVPLLCSAQSRILVLTALARVKYKKDHCLASRKAGNQRPHLSRSPFRVRVSHFSFSLRPTSLTTIRARVLSCVLRVPRSLLRFLPRSLLHILVSRRTHRCKRATSFRFVHPFPSPSPSKSSPRASGPTKSGAFSSPT